MGKQKNTGTRVTTRATFPLTEMLSGDSFLALHTIKVKNEQNAAAMRRMHH